MYLLFYNRCELSFSSSVSFNLERDKSQPREQTECIFPATTSATCSSSTHHPYDSNLTAEKVLRVWIQATEMFLALLMNAIDLLLLQCLCTAASPVATVWSLACESLSP